MLVAALLAYFKLYIMQKILSEKNRNYTISILERIIKAIRLIKVMRIDIIIPSRLMKNLGSQKAE